MANVAAELKAPIFALSLGAKRTVLAYLAVSALVILLMMVIGGIMRAAQGNQASLEADLFYRLMTVHGIGMVGIAALGGAAIMWYFLRQYVPLSAAVLFANLVFFLVGVALILSAVFLGDFAGAWTFLYPLPAMSAGVWGTSAAASYLAGLLVVGVGFLLFFLDVGRAILARYGSPFRALGWPQLFGGSKLPPPPPVVVASTMVVIVNTVCIVVGAVIIALNLVSVYVPGIAISALLAKNMTYFFGHTFINATIYMGVTAVYEILPRYTGRPWTASKVFLGAWTASLVLVLVAFPHHLMMDFVMPTWMLVVGQIASYMNGLPILVVTGYGALTYVYRSGIRWDTTASLLFVSMFGWAAGVIPAILDATIVVNYVMHNTLWVPGHFHFYLMLGLLTMIYGFMYYLGVAEKRGEDTAIDRLAFWAYVIGTLGFVFMFLYAGRESVPRRWAVHLVEWVPYDQIATIFAIVVIVAALVFTVRFLARVPRLAAVP